MLIKISVENYKSFDLKEELSMISSNRINDGPQNFVQIKNTKILNNAVVYGANASGKSNLVSLFSFIQMVLRNGLTVNCMNCFCKNRAENKTRESVFELQFSIGEEFYAYGFSAVLNLRKIKEEWLYKLNEDGGAAPLFTRDENNKPTLGDNINFSDEEENRFKVYSNDFSDESSLLFLAEMNHVKKFNNNSNLKFFHDVFNYLMNNIIVIDPYSGISGKNTYDNEQSINNISALINTFDTGVTSVRTRQISMEEINKSGAYRLLRSMIAELKDNMSKQSELPIIYRTGGDFIIINIDHDGNPDISTIILKHGTSPYEFSFNEESEGTRRLFDLLEIIMTVQSDNIFVVDELDRSLHPKLTEHLLKLFITNHEKDKNQLLFTTHDNAIMDYNLFRRDEIWFIERDGKNASKLYSLDRFKKLYDHKLSKAYLDGRYGAIPVFQQFAFSEGEES